MTRLAIPLRSGAKTALGRLVSRVLSAWRAWKLSRVMPERSEIIDQIKTARRRHRRVRPLEKQLLQITAERLRKEQGR